MDKNSKFDYEALKAKTLAQLRSGKSLFGKDGAFAPLLKDILEAALEGEVEGHLDEEERSTGNRKNGKTSKKLKTADGTIDLETPRDRSGTFDPQIVRKRETILAESLEGKIIGMYSHGMSFRDISAHIKEMYDTEISAATLSAITDKVIPLVKEAGTVEEALSLIVEMDFDVILMDITMPGGGGVAATEKIRALRPMMPILALTMHQENSYVQRMIRAGANGYALKNIGREGLQEAIMRVMNGARYFSQEVMPIARLIAGKEGPFKQLTARQSEVLGMILLGLTDREIARRLYLSVQTVHKHRLHILEKLGAHNAVELVQAAAQKGMLM